MKNVKGNEFIKIDDFLVQKDVLTYRWECDFTNCRGFCCDCGCYIYKDEHDRIASHVKEIAEYLRERYDHPFFKGDFEFRGEPGNDGGWQTKTFDHYCIFQKTSNGACAIHLYCAEHKISVEDFKFAICVDLPLNFKFICGEWQISLHHEIPDKDFDNCVCVRPEKIPISKWRKLHLLIESQKNVIINRIGEDRYKKLLSFATKNNSTTN